MGRYGASELMRNKNLQKKAVDYGMKKLSPFVYDTAGKALDQLSTKIRPDKKYKTDRKDLDGSGVDIHKWIGKLPRPKAGWTPGNYKYMGAYNPLDKQLEYDPETGEVLRWHVMPYNKVYWDKLDKLVDDYNNRKHSSIKMTPTEASKKRNEKQVFANLYEDEIFLKPGKPKFSIGDKVRLSKYKRRVFDKGYTPNWTEVVFVIDKVNLTKPVTYNVVDLLG